jgi:hypothetical protein
VPVNEPLRLVGECLVGECLVGVIGAVEHVAGYVL